MDLPIKNSDFPWFFVCLPEGINHQFGGTQWLDPSPSTFRTPPRATPSWWAWNSTGAVGTTTPIAGWFKWKIPIENGWMIWGGTIFFGKLRIGIQIIGIIGFAIYFLGELMRKTSTLNLMYVVFVGISGEAIQDHGNGKAASFRHLFGVKLWSFVWDLPTR